MAIVNKNLTSACCRPSGWDGLRCASAAPNAGVIANKVYELRIIFFTTLILFFSTLSWAVDGEILDFNDFSKFDINAYYGIEEHDGMKELMLKLPEKTKYGGLQFVAIKFMSGETTLLSTQVYKNSDFYNPKSMLIVTGVKKVHAKNISFYVLYDNALFVLSGFEKL
ncbi:MAG: hypothetical protein JKX92_05450 [Porticoccaceae bacterium]|nr:hypothetical protein [Porticoccaceae bacterium]